MVFSESSGIMNSVRLKNAVKPLKTELKPKALFCNVTISRMDFMLQSLYSNKNTYVLSRSQIFCIKSILNKNKTHIEVYTSILHWNLIILREIPGHENIQMYNKQCIKNCSTEPFLKFRKHAFCWPWILFGYQQNYYWTIIAQWHG